MITDVWMEGSNGMATIKLLPTSHGENIRKMLEAGVKLGVSSRGSGNVDHNGIVSDFEIITIDIVAQPSAQEAYPTAVFESLFKQTGASLSGSARAIKESARPLNKVEDEIHQFFKNFKG